jgi:predicted AAA+ superfamily ATPase
VSYRRRVLDDQLDNWLAVLPAVAIEGAKGVGKTATAERRAGSVHSLDLPGSFANIAGDPSLVLEGGPRPVFIDEWQLVPAVWDVVRHAVDRDPTPGGFLLAGSALPPKEARIHSGAGRIVRALMRPMSFPERGVEEPTVSFADLVAGGAPAVAGRTEVGVSAYADEILASGFPAIRDAAPAARVPLLDSYIDRVVDKHLPEAGAQVRRPAALRAWLAAYAAATASAASYGALLDAATPGAGDKPGRQAGAAYREHLERIWVVEPLPAWRPAFASLKRLGQAPKHHLADPALAARLLGVGKQALIGGAADPLLGAGRTFLGALFESLATQTVRVLAQAAGARVSHMRIDGGAREIDLIVERDDLRVLAIEVKLGVDVGPRDVRHLNWLSQQLPGRVVDRVVIHAGEFARRRASDGVALVPLALLGP